jgi:hypothetical protein
MTFKNRKRLRVPLGVVACVASSFVVEACATGSPSTTAAAARAPAEDVPAQVALSGAPVTLGTQMGTIRQDATVASFSISKTPVTVGEYRECVRAGACTPPAVTTGPCRLVAGLYGATYTDDTEHEQRPVTCATADQAAAYCGWVGGALPSLGQWMLAARGKSVSRYPWGNQAPTCKERAQLASLATSCCGSSCDSDVATNVGMHPAGSSPSGVADVLLTQGELVSAGADSPFGACRSPAAACVVHGASPGAIDFFAGETTGDAEANMLVSSFRCAWGGTGQ